MSVLYRAGCFPEFRNKLHESAFHGDLDKVRLLLGEYCVYQRNLYNETAILHAVSNRKVEVFHELWLIYMNDIKFVRNQIGSGAELDHPIFIAYGAENIVEIENLFQQYLSKQNAGAAAGEHFWDILVLMKSDNFTQTKVIKLGVNSENFTDVMKIIAACFENGVLDLNACNNLGDSLIEIAVCNGLVDIALQVMEYGVSVDMNRIQWSAIKYGQQSVICELEGKCELVPIDTKQSENIDELIRNGSWDGLMYLMVRTGVTVDELMSNSGLTLFHAAIFNYQQDLAEKCWDLKPNYKTVSSYGSLPVHDAIGRGFKKLVTRMLNDDSSLILVSDQSGQNCLHLMAAANWMDELRDIFEKNPNLKAEFFQNAEMGVQVLKNLMGWRYDIAEFIIRETIDTVSEDTFYAIFNAVAGSRFTDTLKFLLGTKSVDLRKSSESPIIIAFKEFQIENVKLLLDHAGGYLNEIFDEDHNNLLKYAIYSQPSRPRFFCGTGLDPYDFPEMPDLFEFVDEENPSNLEMNHILDDLLAKGVDYNNTNTAGMNLLHIAANGANLYAIRKFLELGVDENHKDNSGFLPLYYSKNIPSIKLFTPNTYEDIPTYLFAERPKLLEYVLEHGANVAVENEEKQTALHFVRRLDACRTLLNHNANVNHVDANGDTPIHAVFSRWSYKIGMHMLATEGADFKILDKNGNSYLKYFLIPKVYSTLYQSEQFLDLITVHCNDIDEFCMPYLHMALEKNETLTKIFLAQPNIDVSVRNTETGDTSLHCAAYYNKIDMIKEFLGRGMDVNVRNTANQTPLHVAVRQRNFETVDFLLEHGGNVDLADTSGLTPLHDAAQNDESGVQFCRLLEKSLDPSVCDINEKTPCDMLPERLRRMFYFV